MKYFLLATWRVGAPSYRYVSADGRHYRIQRADSIIADTWSEVYQEYLKMLDNTRHIVRHELDYHIARWEPPKVYNGEF